MSAELFTDTVHLLMLALATSAVSVTVTRSGMFLGLRTWIAKRSSWLGDLVHCPYCMSHWISLVFMWWYDLRILPETYWLVDLLVSALAIVAVASFFTLLVSLSYKHAVVSTKDTTSGTEMLRGALVKARETIVAQQARIKELGG